jgi:LPS sulfotransferase NodH
VCKRLLGSPEEAAATTESTSPEESPRPTNVPWSADSITKFVIVCAERTGSNLLADMLATHPDLMVGGELFNRDFVDTGLITWPDRKVAENRDVIALRRSDPSMFLARLFESAQNRKRHGVGFKLMYYHGDEYRDVRDALVADETVRVIHMKRRNLLRRLLSERRAAATGVWWVAQGERAPKQPTIDLDFLTLMFNVEHIEAKQDEYDRRFEGHEVLEVFYEDFASDPHGTANRALEFLGLPPHRGMEVRGQKTGTDSLKDAIENYDELKARVLRMASYFDD